MHAAARARFAFVELLERSAPAIRREALALPGAGFVPMASDTYRGRWCIHALALGPWAHEFPGVDLAANRLRCPETVAVLDRIGGVGVAGIMRLDAGAEILPHTDFRDDHEVRCHLALQLPASEQGLWPEGTARLMDVRVPHGARNDSDRPRFTLLIDVRTPFVVTPDLWG
jgi:hypothetical protein